MSCQCYQIGGPFIAEDPDCYEHGWASKDREREFNENVELAVLERTKWINVKDRLPEPGMIVKRWKNGSVWAGYYSGSDKASSFDSWITLPV